MAAFQFPDPAVTTTVKNPITGSTYQWKEPPGKWVVTVSMRDVGDIIWEGDNPPNPIGDYKLWYSTDTLELYFYYCDANGVCAWLPTSVPIQVLEDLNAFAAQAEVDIDQLQYKQQLLQNALDQIYLNQQTGVSARSPIFSDTEPTVHPDFTAPDNALVAGDKWYDITDVEQLIEYVHDGTQWILTGNYVKKKGGDTMEGQLIINGPRKAGDDVDNPKLVSSVKVLSIDNAQNSSLQLRHSGNAKVYVGDTDISVASDIKFNRAVGSVVKTNVQDILNIGESEIAYLGRSIEDEDLITKKYVDDAKEFLQSEIIELEEEIDAIAPSVERGRWTFTAVGTVSQPGQFTMYDADFGNGSPTGLFKSARSIWFNELDIDGTPHAFGDVADGELLEIFIDGSPEFGLFSVIGDAHDETQSGTKFWVIDVNFVRTNESTTAVGPGELCRFKIFMAPSGGDASAFVLKTGDTMTGNLDIDRSDASNDIEAGLTLKGSRSSTTNSAATITFDNKQAQEKGYLTYRAWATGGYFSLNQDLDLKNNGLHSVGQIRMQPGLNYIGAGNSSRIKINNGTNSEAGTEIQRPGDGKRTFAIKGKAANSGTVADFFWAFGNTGSGGDAINYTGLTTQDNHIATKKYVDSKAGGVDISCETTGRSKGDMWYCSTDQVLYIKVS